MLLPRIATIRHMNASLYDYEGFAKDCYARFSEHIVACIFPSSYLTCAITFLLAGPCSRLRRRSPKPCGPSGLHAYIQCHLQVHTYVYVYTPVYICTSGMVFQYGVHQHRDAWSLRHRGRGDNSRRPTYIHRRYVMYNTYMYIFSFLLHRIYIYIFIYYRRSSATFVFLHR